MSNKFQRMKISNFEYEIINECKCGPEELFVLMSSIDYNSQREIDLFFDSLLKLVNNDLLVCRSNKDIFKIKREHLYGYLKIKLENNESLENHSDFADEYLFESTKKAIELLKEEDKPI